MHHNKIGVLILKNGDASIRIEIIQLTTSFSCFLLLLLVGYCRLIIAGVGIISSGGWWVAE